MAIEALMPNLSSASASRQKPTRLPHSCQVQFGMSGVGTPPAGGVFTVRGIGELMSHSSMETSTQTAMRLPSGNASFGRRVIGEYGMRSIGSVTAGPLDSVWTRRCGARAKWRVRWCAGQIGRRRATRVYL
jgi:hypothetical protein